MLVGSGVAVGVDPLPSETATRDVCVLAVALGAENMEDPGGYGSETPAEQTAEWLADLIRQTMEEIRTSSPAVDSLSAGIVAYRDAVDVALRAAVQLGDAIDRLALVAVAAPEQPLDRDDLGALIEGVSAETLVLNGQSDETAAAWYQEHLMSTRIELVPDEASLSLSSVWGRVLSHVAPGTKR